MIMVSARLTRRWHSCADLTNGAIPASLVGSNFAARLAPQRQYLAANGYAATHLDALFVISARRFGWMRGIRGTTRWSGCHVRGSARWTGCHIRFESIGLDH